MECGGSCVSNCYTKMSTRKLNNMSTIKKTIYLFTLLSTLTLCGVEDNHRASQAVAKDELSERFVAASEDGHGILQQKLNSSVRGKVIEALKKRGVQISRIRAVDVAWEDFTVAVKIYVGNTGYIATRAKDDTWDVIMTFTITP